jgi:hypothetical protein
VEPIGGVCLEFYQQSIVIDKTSIVIEKTSTVNMLTWNDDLGTLVQPIIRSNEPGTSNDRSTSWLFILLKSTALRNSLDELANRGPR